MTRPNFEPEAFVNYVWDLKMEVGQLRKRRAECVDKYEQLRRRVHGVVIYALEASNRRKSGTPQEAELAIRDLLGEIFREPMI